MESDAGTGSSPNYSQASIPSPPGKYNARLYSRGLSKIAHSAYSRLQLLANAVIAASRVDSYPWVGDLADTENYNSPSKRRLPRIAALASFLPSYPPPSSVAA